MLLLIPATSLQGHLNYGDAMRWYREQAAQGYPRAQFLLGYKYEIGEGLARDYAEARAWYAKAAAQGHVRAMYRLARLHHHGLGGPVDMAAAARLYRRAAERGHVKSQAVLGYLYSLGEGVEANLVTAYVWTKLAARGGSAAARKNVEKLKRYLTPEQIAAGDARVESFVPKGGEAPSEG